MRPFARLQSTGGRERYTNYFARLIHYALRMLESERTRAEREEESSISSENDNGSSEKSDGDGGDSTDSERSNIHSQSSTTARPAKGRPR